MYDLILFVMFTVGIVNIIQNESIFGIFRRFFDTKLPKVYKFITCPACFGFWMGTLLSLYFNLANDPFINAFICGVVSSISNKVYAKFNEDTFGEI